MAWACGKTANERTSCDFVCLSFVRTEVPLVKTTLISVQTAKSCSKLCLLTRMMGHPWEESKEVGCPCLAVLARTGTRNAECAPTTTPPHKNPVSTYLFPAGLWTSPFIAKCWALLHHWSSFQSHPLQFREVLHVNYLMSFLFTELHLFYLETSLLATPTVGATISRMTTSALSASRPRRITWSMHEQHLIEGWEQW